MRRELLSLCLKDLVHRFLGKLLAMASNLLAMGIKEFPGCFGKDSVLLLVRHLFLIASCY